MELRKGFSHTLLVINDYRAVRSEGCHLEGHNHTMVVV